MTVFHNLKCKSFRQCISLSEITPKPACVLHLAETVSYLETDSQVEIGVQILVSSNPQPLGFFFF